MVPFFENKERRAKLTKILDSWLGTPYRRNTGIKTRGADCSLFLAHVFFEAGVLREIVKPQYLPCDWHIHGARQIFLESIEAHTARLCPGLFLCTIEAGAPFMFGDWIVFCVGRRMANHSAMFIGGENEKIIHSKEKIGVVKEPIRRWEPFYYTAFRLYQDQEV